MAISKEGLDFRKRINRSITEDRATDYIDARNREIAYEEYCGKTGMATRKNKELYESEFEL